MPRNETVSVNSKDIIVQEKRIKELEELVKNLFPESEGKFANIEIDKVIERAGFDMLYEELPKIASGLAKEDIENAYMSELEELLEAFVNVNFTGIKKLIKPLMNMAQISLQSRK